MRRSLIYNGSGIYKHNDMNGRKETLAACQTQRTCSIYYKDKL